MMGGIVIIVNSSFGTHRWGGHAEDVMNFFKKKDVAPLASGQQGDMHNGTITFDVEEKKIIIDSDYFTPDQEVIRFWRVLGFDVLGRLRDRSEDP